MPRYTRGFDTEAAFAHLSKRDRKLGAWMRKLGRIEADMLPPEILSTRLQGDSRMSSMMGAPLREARENFEREYLRVQIRRFSGNISKTAAFIGMERSALHRKLKLLGLADRRGEGDEDEEE